MGWKVRRFGDDTSAQMHTLEAIISVTIMISVIVFAVQATSLTPLTSSTANAHIEAQLQMIGQDMLTAIDYSPEGQNSPLKNDILSWNGTEYSWDGNAYACKYDINDTLVNSSIGDILEFVAVQRGIAHNVDLRFIDAEGNIGTVSYINNGEPSNNGVTVSRKVLISETDFIDAASKASFEQNTKIEDIDGVSTYLYNIVDVRLTLWRM